MKTRIGWLLSALLAACIAFQLNASMLTPAIGDMQRRLSATPAQVGLSTTLFFLAAGLFSVFLPRLSDMLGRRRVLLGMLTVMALGTVLAIFAPTIEVLYVARAIQGVSGPTVPLCLLVLHSAVEPRRFGTLMGVITAVNGGIAGVDVIAGGALADTVGFRGIFVVTLVVALIAIGFVAKAVPESRPSAQARMDWLGVVLLCAALGALILGLPELNWPLIIGSLVVFGVFVWWQSRTHEPLLPLPVLRTRAVWALLLTTVLTMTGVFGTINFLMPSLAEDHAVGFGWSASTVSLLLLMPYAVLGWVVGPFAGRAAPRLGWRLVLRVGLVLSLVAVAVTLLAGLQSRGWMIACALLLGFGYAGIANIVLNGLGVVLSPPDAQGLLPGLNAGAFNIGASLGVVLLSSAISDDGLAGYRAGLILAIVITVVALAASFLLPRPRAGEA